jgi:FMN-dependent NADH-azoreductase
MKTLLCIDSSPRGERSNSRRLTGQFTKAWLGSHKDGEVVRRDLGAVPVPTVSEDWIAAAFSNPSAHTPAQRAAIASSDELIDELLGADEVLIGAPMYNFSVTASLKAWIDQVVRVGRTVEYPSFAGMVHGKRATIISTRGGPGMEPGGSMAHLDAQVPYLRQILGFIGIRDFSVVYAGSLAGSEEESQSSMDKAAAEIEDLASR